MRSPGRAGEFRGEFKGEHKGEYRGEHDIQWQTRSATTTPRGEKEEDPIAADLRQREEASFGQGLLDARQFHPQRHQALGPSSRRVMDLERGWGAEPPKTQRGGEGRPFVGNLSGFYYPGERRNADIGTTGRTLGVENEASRPTPTAAGASLRAQARQAMQRQQSRGSPVVIHTREPEEEKEEDELLLPEGWESMMTPTAPQRPLGLKGKERV